MPSPRPISEVAFGRSNLLIYDTRIVAVRVSVDDNFEMNVNIKPKASICSLLMAYYNKLYLFYTCSILSLGVEVVRHLSSQHFCGGGEMCEPCRNVVLVV